MSKSSSCALVAALVVARGLGAQSVTAQDLGNIPIAVAVPSSLTMLTTDQKEQLASKLLEVVTMNGMSAVGGPAGLQLRPNLTLNSERRVGELRKFTVVNLTLSVAIKQTTHGLAFSSASLPITGSGDQKESAITAAIGSIAPDNESLQKALETGKKRIVDYYQSSCDAIRSDANARASTGKGDEAIAMLMSVPREAPACQQAAAADAAKIYAAYHERECQSLVREARGDVANRAFEAAVKKIARVDPASGCAKSADALLDDIEQKVTKENNRSFEIRIQAMRVERKTVTETIKTPEGRAKHQEQQTRAAAVDYYAKLETRPHIVDPH